MIKQIKLFLIFFSVCIQSFSQNIYLTERQQIEDTIVVLSDTSKLIPLQRLDTLKILTITFGNSDYTAFAEMIKNYTESDFINFDSLAEIKNIISEKYNLLIFCTDTVSEINIFNSISDLKIKTFFCSFAKDNSLINKVFEDKFNAIILSFGKTENYQDLTAQLIFGGIAAKNKLKTDINKYFKSGSGIISDKKIRFKYTTPYELGIDSVELTHKIDSIVNDGISKFAFPGCQVLIAKDQKIFFSKSYGYQTYDSITAININTIYDLASVTKIVAPLPCLMKLYDEKKIDINSRFSDYWKPFRKSNKNEFTVKDALAHQAQLKAWIPFWKNLYDENGEYVKNTIKQDSSKRYCVKIADDKYLNKNYYKQIYKQIKKSPLEPKKKYLYSDLSFYLYPTIIENLSKTEYEDYLYNNFYKILGCNSMRYNPLRYFPVSEIAPTENDTIFRKEQIHGKVHDEGAILLNGVSGHAGMFANANDLAKIMQMYLNYGEYGNYRFISDTTLKQFSSYQFPENGNRRGLGFDKPSLENRSYDTASPDASSLSFGHTGFTGTFVWVDPENGLLIVFLSNRVYPSRDNKNLMNLNIRTQIHQAVYDALK